MILIFIHSCSEKNCEKINLPSIDKSLDYFYPDLMYLDTDKDNVYYLRYNKGEFCAVGTTFLEGQLYFNIDSIYMLFYKVYVDTTTKRVPFSVSIHENNIQFGKKIKDFFISEKGASVFVSDLQKKVIVKDEKIVEGLETLLFTTKYHLDTIKKGDACLSMTFKNKQLYAIKNNSSISLDTKQRPLRQWLDSLL